MRGIMNTSPDLFHGEETFEEREQPCSPVQITHAASESRPWARKAIACVQDVSEVLKTARKKLVPEVEALVFRFVLLGMLFYHIMRVVAFLIR
jgi:hypothetical protein